MLITVYFHRLPPLCLLMAATPHDSQAEVVLTGVVAGNVNLTPHLDAFTEVVHLHTGLQTLWGFFCSIWYLSSVTYQSPSCEFVALLMFVLCCTGRCFLFCNEWMNLMSLLKEPFTWENLYANYKRNTGNLYKLRLTYIRITKKTFNYHHWEWIYRIPELFIIYSNCPDREMNFNRYKFKGLMLTWMFILV